MNLKKREITGYLALVIIVSALLYSYNNPAKINTWLGEFLYKRNNIPVAQLYLEKAFANGVKDSSVRDLYVNTIINSPFDTDAQQKLKNFLSYPIDDDAKRKAMTFLADFRREVYKNYPENYITQTVYNQQVMRWNEIPVTYTFKNTAGVPEYFKQEIENAFTRWEVATEHQLLFTQNDTNPNIIIDFNSDNKVDPNSRKYIVAYTIPSLNANVLQNMTIKFYLKDYNGEYYSKNQVYNTALHEIVHALGFMGHSGDNEDVMHSTKDSKAVVNDKRIELTQGDINTVKLLYKIKPDITNNNNSSGIYTPFLILGGEQRIQKAKMNEAVSYVNRAPNIANGYIDLADGYVAKKDYDSAIKSLKKALKLADSTEMRSMIFYNLAVVYYYSENYPMSEKYILALLKYKDTEDSRYLLAQVYSKNGQTAKSVEEYKNLLRINPNNIEYVIGLTNLYVTERKYMDARKVLRDYIKLNPSERNNPRLKSYGIIRMFI